MEKQNKVKHLNNAVRLWCLNKGYEEIPGVADLTFRGEDKTVGFILKEEKTDREILSKITKAKIFCDKVYIVITDPIKRAKTLTIIPKECGLICFSDPFGLGYMFGLFKEATEE